jgi:FolB domain-containing protein
MTLFVASVTGPEEAELALAQGADVIDLEDTAHGVLGPIEPTRVRETVKAVGGRRPVSAAAGNLPMQPDVLEETVVHLAEAGADYVRVALFPDQQPEACIRVLAGVAARARIIGVMFAEHRVDGALIRVMAECGFAGAMLDTSHKSKGRLFDGLSIREVGDFIETVRAHGMMAGLAGALEAPDVPRLLPLAPEFLVFRNALRVTGGAPQTPDADTLAIIRALVPIDGARAAGKGHASPAAVDYRLLSPRGSHGPDKDAMATDRVFVRDLVVPVRVGAYARERDKPQNVRFNVDAKVLRSQHGVEDMRDVFSYDLIIDGIGMIVTREHIPLVETLAERIAALVLNHARVTSVTVRVEKLDVGPGAVGVEITRERPAEAAKVHHLFPNRVSEPEGR